MKIFDIAEHLDSEAVIEKYLKAFFEEDSAVFVSALYDVARARGMHALSE